MPALQVSYGTDTGPFIDAVTPPGGGPVDVVVTPPGGGPAQHLSFNYVFASSMVMLDAAGRVRGGVAVRP